MAEKDIDKIRNCSDEDKRQILHSLSKERLVEMIIRLTKKENLEMRNHR